MNKYFFIDGSNLCYRVFWTHKTLSHNNSSVGLLFGFFKNLIGLKKQFPDYIFTVVWDSKSIRRNKESQEGVEKGILSYSYKSARKEKSEETNETFKDMFSQMDRLKESLSLMNINQVASYGVEADDIIHSYCKKITDSEILILTSDKDYYQLLSDKVSIYDPIKKYTLTKTAFTQEFGIEPQQWVEVGGICGDKGDSIQGADGWGDITALKYIKQYGTLENVLKAVEEKQEKNKKEIALLSFRERLFVARSLKQMDIVENLPEIKEKTECEKDKLKNFFIENGFASLLLDVGRLVN